MGISSYNEPVGEIKCKICFLYENPITDIDDLISPCKCKGTMKYVHESCLKMWRFRGKSYEDTKKCCQCGFPYMINGEFVPGPILILALTVIGCLFIFYIGMTIIMLSLKIGLVVLKDRFIEEPRTIFIQSQSRNLLKEFDFITVGLVKIDFRYVYTFVFVVFYMITTYQNFFSVFNYVFTFWRMLQFDFLIDRILFIAVSCYYFWFMIRFINLKVEHFLITVFNRK